VRLGVVTSSDGSRISTPWSTISRKVPSQAPPKEIVWWVTDRGTRAALSWITNAEGDHRSRSGRRDGMASSLRFSAGPAARTTASQQIDPVGVRTARTRPPVLSSVVAVVP
jgi:hypothetical protein